MESVADDVMNKILETFPIETLCLLKCVSKPLNTFIQSPNFTKLYDELHFHQTSSADGLKPIKLIVVGNSRLHTSNIDHKNPSRPLALGIRVTNTQLVGSSNGLVCLYHRPNSYSLLNPTTREFRVLPDPGTFRISRKAPIRLSGFGYDLQLDDFMVVSAAIHKYGVFPPVIKVYSAKADSWETMPAGVNVPAHSFTSTVSVYVNGVAHWLGWTGFVDAFGKDSRVLKIMGFDFANKEFKLMPLHENINHREIMAFSVLDGRLCVLARDADLSLEMWVMKKYGVVESWTKTFSFRRATTQKSSVSIFPIWYAGNEVLFEINDRLVLYDQDTDIFTKLKAGLWGIREREGRVLQIAKYEESLVSPSGYICQDKRQIRIDEENEGVNQESVYGASQSPRLCDILHQIYHPFINTSGIS